MNDQIKMLDDILPLIKNLNHQFTMSTPPSVYTVLDLVRDSYGSQDNESTIK